MIEYILYFVGLLVIAGLLFVMFGVFMKPKYCSAKLYHGPDSLNETIVKNCRQLQMSWCPPFWGRNGHLQTIVYNFFARKGKVKFDRELIRLDDMGTVALDWAASESNDAIPSNAELIVCLPGLSGDADSLSYLCERGLLAGFRPVVFNKRGHGNSQLTTPKLQSFGDPSDVRQAIMHCRNRFPTSKIFACGISAGSGLLVSYCGEYSKDPCLEGIACISPGYDAEELFKRGIGRPYDKILLKSIKSLVMRHAEVLKNVIDIPKVAATSKLEDFEYEVYGKLYGFKDLSSYWKKNNPMRDMGQEVGIPGLIMSSADDPVCLESNIDFKVPYIHKNLILAVTEYGGHVGFMQAGSLASWADETAIEYFQTLLRFK